MAPALDGMSHFNGTLAEERNPLLPDTFFTPGVGAQDQAVAVKDLCERYRCQGLLAGKLTAQGNELSLSLRLFVPSLPGYDESQSAIVDATAAASAVSLVDRPLDERAQLQLIDLPGAKGPVFVRGMADPGGPVAGDVLLSVGAKAVATVGAAQAVLTTADSPALRFSHRGEERTWYLKRESLIELVPFGGETFGYRRQWLKARQGVAGSETSQEKLVSGLCLAYANLNLGRPVEAMSALEPLQPPSSGVLDQNTVDYLKAVALVQLGRAEEGRAYLKAAAGDPVASLDGTGCVLVAPLALDLLRQLPPPPPPPAAARAKVP